MKKSYNKIKLLILLTLLNVLFLTTSLLALEDNFDVIKNPYKPIVLSDFSNFSWNDVVFENSSFTEKGFFSTKGMANIFRWNDIYLTYLTDNNTLQIKKLNTAGTNLEDFLTIGNCKFKEFANSESNIGVYGCATLYKTSNDCYIYFFGSQRDSNKLVIIRVSLKTKAVFRHVEAIKLIPIDAITYNGYIYMLSCKDASDKFSIIQFNPKDFSITSTTNLPSRTFLFWTSLAYQDNELIVGGNLGVSNAIAPIRCRLDSNNGNIAEILYYTGQNYQGNSNYYDVYNTKVGESIKTTYARAQAYRFDGKNYAYMIERNAIKNCPGFAVLQNHAVSFKKFSDLNLYAGCLYADDTGLYIGYVNSSIQNQVGFIKRKLDGTIDSSLDRFFYNDEDYNTVDLKQTNSMLVTEFNGNKRMLMMVSGYYNNMPKTVLYFLPAESKYSQVFFDDGDGYTTDSIISPKTYPKNYGSYRFKIKYINFQNIPLNSNPILYLYNNGKLVKNDGFKMSPINYNDNNYTDGKIYSYTLDASEIGKIRKTDNYTYRIKIGDKLSKEFLGPVFYGRAEITNYDGTYVVPKKNINSKEDISIQISYNNFVENEGIKPADGYPRVFIYKNIDSTNPIKVNGNNYTVLFPIEDSINGYRADIGKLPVGRYIYKIKVKNEVGFENSVDGNFTVKDTDISVN